MTRNRFLSCCVASFILGVAAMAWTGSATGDNEQPKPSLLYELRTYTTNPGELPALHDRFRNHTLRLFEKHGMKNVIYWVPTDEKLKDTTLVYVVAHKNLEAADRSWEAFRKDPEWQKVFAETTKDGKLKLKVDKQFLVPTDYSPER